MLITSIWYLYEEICLFEFAFVLQIAHSGCWFLCCQYLIMVTSDYENSMSTSTVTNYYNYQHSSTQLYSILSMLVNNNSTIKFTCPVLTSLSWLEFRLNNFAQKVIYNLNQLFCHVCLASHQFGSIIN